MVNEWLSLFQAYDRHVEWCEEKSRRMQCSPTKDMVALAKLHARVAYRPKTPNRKDSSGSNPKTRYTKFYVLLSLLATFYFICHR